MITAILSSTSMYFVTLIICILPDYLSGAYETEVGNFVSLVLVIGTVICFIVTVIYWLIVLCIYHKGKNEL